MPPVVHDAPRAAGDQRNGHAGIKATSDTVVNHPLNLSHAHSSNLDLSGLSEEVKIDGFKEGHVLHPDLLNPNLRKTQYAVRGELYLRAQALAKEGRDIIFTNVGNPQSLGAHPLTFTRQVIALCCAPFLLDHPSLTDAFPADAVQRARELLASFGSMGAYQDSRGNAVVRQHVADFISRRDGVPADPDLIYLTDGASPGVRSILMAMIRSPRDAVLVPIPQYPLYSALIQLLGGRMVPYMLDEEGGWSLQMGSIREAVAAARSHGSCVRGLVFINPGNPTGQVLSRDNLAELVRFAHDEHMVLMADEVYQENIYLQNKPFISARKVVHELGEPYASTELVSFHTVSKGIGGECGLRGGYFELLNLHPKAVEQLYKMASINLSPNSIGQVAVSCMVKPPEEGDPSHPLWLSEYSSELESLKRRARLVTEAFNALEGVSCNPTEGAMYAFPRLELPPRAIAAAKAAGKAPDVYYCLSLLDSTGIVTIPGSGFGQEEGTFHLRTTFLPREETMANFVEKFTTFHSQFMAKFT